MDLYTLTSTFIDDWTLDEFVSAIWTERYSEAGDVQLVVADSYQNRMKLAPGTYLAMRGSKEVMELETQEIDSGLITIKGRSLLQFFNARYAWFQNPVSSATNERIVDFTDATRKPGEFLGHIVNMLVINPAAFLGEWAPANLDWEKDKLPGLEIGVLDASGVVERLTMPVGPMYDGLARVAKQTGIGISLYLDSADPDQGFTLKFKTYRGLDRTSGQLVNELVRLVPELDGITDLKEISSNALYRNVAYVYYEGTISEHLAEPSLPEPEGWNRRILVTNAEGEPVGRKVSSYTPVTYGYRYGPSPYSEYHVGPEEKVAFREQNAKDALANANYIQTVDGETSPNSEYIFGKDYGLGDIIELEGITGTLSKARVTEFIRSHDKSGEKNYPTISVINSAGEVNP